MSLTAISSLESDRRKFFMNSTQNMSWNQTQEAENESNSHQLARIGEKKIFHDSSQNMCKLGINVFGLRRPK